MTAQGEIFVSHDAERDGKQGPRTSVQDALQKARLQLDEVLARHSGDPDAWREDLRKKLRSVSRAFASHTREAEGAGGTLSEISRLRPDLIHSVDIIKQEHRSIAAEITLLERIVEGPWLSVSRDIEFLRESTGKILESIRMHSARGGDLLYEASYRDYAGPG